MCEHGQVDPIRLPMAELYPLVHTYMPALRVCMYLCIRTYIHACTPCMYLWVYRYIHACLHSVHVCMCMYRYIYACLHSIADTPIYIHTGRNTYIYTYTQTGNTNWIEGHAQRSKLKDSLAEFGKSFVTQVYIYTCIHAYIHTHVHTHLRTQLKFAG